MSYGKKNLSFNSYLVSAKFGCLEIYLYLCGCKIIKNSALNQIINQKKMMNNEKQTDFLNLSVELDFNAA